jgi:glycosyltransferase involved in cell wall biosynthesis
MINAFREIGCGIDIVGMVTPDNKETYNHNRSSISRIASRLPQSLYEVAELLYNFYGLILIVGKIVRSRPDFIYERYSLDTVAGVLASKIFSIPLILEVNSPLAYEKLKYSRLRYPAIAKFFERWICSNSSITIAVTMELKKMLVLQNVPTDKIVVMYNGINPEIFNLKVSGKKIREKYNLKGKIVIGFVGWFREWHGIELIINLMTDKKAWPDELRLLLVGDGPAFKKLQTLVKQHCLLSSVIFTGSVPHSEITDYIAAVDIAIQPKATEYACPMKIIEYMAMGKCILAKDQPNIRELIENGYNGFLFQDQNSMMSLLLELASDSKKRKEIGNNAHKTIIERDLLWTSNARRVVDIVSEV